MHVRYRVAIEARTTLFACRRCRCFTISFLGLRFGGEFFGGFFDISKQMFDFGKSEGTFREGGYELVVNLKTWVLVVQGRQDPFQFNLVGTRLGHVASNQSQYPTNAALGITGRISWLS